MITPLHSPLEQHLLGLESITTTKVIFRILQFLIGIIIFLFLTEMEYPLKLPLASITSFDPSRQALYWVLVKLTVDVVLLKGKEP